MKFTVNQIGMTLLFAGVSIALSLFVALSSNVLMPYRIFCAAFATIIFILAVFVPKRAIYFDGDDIKIKYYGLIPKKKVEFKCTDIESVEFIKKTTQSKGIKTVFYAIKLHVEGRAKSINIDETERNFKKLCAYLVEGRDLGKIRIKENTYGRIKEKL